MADLPSETQVCPCGNWQIDVDPALGRAPGNPWLLAVAINDMVEDAVRQHAQECLTLRRLMTLAQARLRAPAN